MPSYISADPNKFPRCLLEKKKHLQTSKTKSKLADQILYQHGAVRSNILTGSDCDPENFPRLIGLVVIFRTLAEFKIRELECT